MIAKAAETNIDGKDEIANQDEMNEETQNEGEKERRDTRRRIADGKNQSNEPFDKMKLIKENLFLLSEIDKLKKSNHSLSQRIYYLETIVPAPPKVP